MEERVQTARAQNSSNFRPGPLRHARAIGPIAVSGAGLDDIDIANAQLEADLEIGRIDGRVSHALADYEAGNTQLPQRLRDLPSV